MDVFAAFSEIYARESYDEMSLQAYLMACRDDHQACTPAQPSG